MGSRFEPSSASNFLHTRVASCACTSGARGYRPMKKAPKRTGPSRMSLREMPEVDLKDGRWRPNEYTARIAQGSHVAEARQAEVGRGESGPSVIRSVRFPTDLQGQYL